MMKQKTIPKQIQSFKQKLSFRQIVIVTAGITFIIVALFTFFFFQFGFSKEGKAGSSSNHGSAASNTGTGDNDWTDLNEVFVEDGAPAYVQMTHHEDSKFLTVTDFGFNIPTDSVIQGITVTIRKKKHQGAVKDDTIQLLKNGVRTGNNYPDDNNWTGTYQTVVYGDGNTDLWGTTWTPQEINTPNFGVALKVNSTNANKTAQVDYINIEIHYGQSESSLLPIELSTFKASKTDAESVQLTWSTTMEHNNERFEIERSSRGEDYQLIGILPGAGNSDEVIHYEYEDINPILGTSYYRLKQIDFDGKFSYSDVLMVEMDKEQTGELSISPNPVTEDRINISINASKGQYILTITDLSGSVLKQEVIEMDEEKLTRSLSIGDLNAGTYIVALRNESQLYTAKMQKR